MILWSGAGVAPMQDAALDTYFRSMEIDMSGGKAQASVRR